MLCQILSLGWAQKFNADHPLAEQECTVAHELGHHVLDHISQPSRPPQERDDEADRFGSTLLMFHNMIVFARYSVYQLLECLPNVEPMIRDLQEAAPGRRPTNGLRNDCS